MANFCLRTITDLRGVFGGFAALGQKTLSDDPFSIHVFAFRGRRGYMLKLLWWDGDGFCLLSKPWSVQLRLAQGGIGPHASAAAQLSTLLEGIDW